MKDLTTEIDACITKTTKNNKITWDDFVLNLKDVIINNHDNEPLASYKSTWRSLFKERCEELKVATIDSRKGKWGEVEAQIKGKGPATTTTTTASTSSATTSTATATTTTSSSSSSSTTTTSSSSNSSTTSNKNYKLSPTEKANVIIMYNSLSKLWKLSTGVHVEVVMKKLAEESIFEHPAHSLIFDPTDSNCANYFTQEEIKEVVSFNASALPLFPSPLRDFIDTFKCIELPEEVYDKASATIIKLTGSKDLLWIKDTVQDVSKLFYLKTLPPLPSSSEAFILNVVWGFVYKLFYGSKIEALIGEKSSSASSSRRNANRKLETTQARLTSRMGHKIDVLFRGGNYEVGCVEAGTLQKDENTDKCMDDGLLKLPKQMKDMMHKMVTSRPDLAHSLKTVGLIIMGNQIQMVLMDIPSGSICRIQKTKAFYFPADPAKIAEGLSPLFQLVWKAKKIMEDTLSLMNSELEEEVDLVSSISPVFLPPCFSKEVIKNAKKRKLEAEE